MTLIIGNTIALIASLLMVYVGLIKSRRKILYVQSIEIGLFVLSNLVLGGIPGAIINAINFIRNTLCYHNKLGIPAKIILTIISVVLTVYYNNIGLIGYLPLISATIYLWFITIKDIKKFKLLIVFTIVLWLIYDITIQSYTSALFDILSIITGVISVIRLKNS